MLPRAEYGIVWNVKIQASEKYICCGPIAIAFLSLREIEFFIHLDCSERLSLRFSAADILSFSQQQMQSYPSFSQKVTRETGAWLHWTRRFGLLIIITCK
jgi:hypothetical protein